MAKKAKVYTGTEWVDLAAATTDLSSLQTKTATGLNLIIPTSVTGGTLSANGQITFSASTNVQVSGCFSSTYDTYYITGSMTGTSAGVPVVKLRDGSGDLTGSYKSSITSQSSDNLHNTGVTSNWQLSYYNQTSFAYNFEVINPFLSSITFALGKTFYDNSLDTWGGQYTPTTSCTGISIMPSAGTFTGRFRIYGYNNGV